VAVAYVTTGANYPDALAGGPAAAREGGPVLLVRHGAVSLAVAAELDRLNPARIVVLGGPAVVSDAVAASLAAYIAP
jgi:putative cell wall-binding protein